MCRTFVMSLRELVWPMVEEPSNTEQEQATQARRQTREDLSNMNVDADPDFALEEARRIAVEEDRRVDTVQTRAYQLLLFIGVLTSFLTFLGDYQMRTGGWGPSLTSGILVTLAVVYSLRSALWALRTVDVGHYRRVQQPQVRAALEDSNPKATLASELLLATYDNREVINQKVTCSAMARALMVRAVFVVGLLVLFGPAHDLYLYLESNQTVEVCIT